MRRLSRRPARQATLRGVFVICTAPDGRRQRQRHRHSPPLPGTPRPAPVPTSRHLLVLIGGKTFVVEYKTGDSVGEVYDALPQVVQYWTEHVSRDQAYVAGGTELQIDGFLTATSHSPSGRLFPRYAETRQDHADMDETRQECYSWGQLPPAEYRMTEQHIRTMWRMVKETGINGATEEDTPHIGSLLSDVLVEPSPDPSPAVLWNAGATNQSWEVFNG